MRKTQGHSLGYCKTPFSGLNYPAHSERGSLEFSMFLVTREIRFCYGHRLLDYAGKCRHLHGHNGRAVISLAADQLDDLGMVMDFSHIKRVVSTWIDDNLDHKMILNRKDPILPLLQKQGEPVYLLDANPTAENIARLIYDFTKNQGFPVVRVHLWETDDSYATYQENI